MNRIILILLESVAVFAHPEFVAMDAITGLRVMFVILPMVIVAKEELRVIAIFIIGNSNNFVPVVRPLVMGLFLVGVVT